MSSHHIVREKQEPALFILNLEGFHHENLGQLLEWSPTVIVAEETYDAAESLGIKIDFIVGSLAAEHGLQPQTQILSSEEDILRGAMDYLIREHYPAVNIVTSKPVVSDYYPYCESINIVILSDEQRIFTVRSGFTKWKPAGETIRILSESTDLVHSGLTAISSNMYTTNSDGFYSLQFSEPFIFVAENL